MPVADQVTARIDRDPPADPQVAGLDRLERVTRPVMPKWLIAMYSLMEKQSCVSVAVEGIQDGPADVRQHVRIVGRAVQLLLQVRRRPTTRRG